MLYGVITRIKIVYPHIWWISEHIIHLAIVLVNHKCISTHYIPFNILYSICRSHSTQVLPTFPAFFCVKLYAVDKRLKMLFEPFSLILQTVTCHNFA